MLMQIVLSIVVQLGSIPIFSHARRQEAVG
jgi:hypothetical protein